MRFRILGVAGVLAAWIFAGAFASTGHASELKGKFEQTLKVSGAAKVDVRTGSGDISLRTGDESTVRIRGTIHMNDRNWEDGDAEAKLRDLEQHPPIEQEGNSVRIGHLEEMSGHRNYSIDYELVVPPGSDLIAKTGSGDLSLSGPLARVEVQTGSGDVSVESVKGSVRLTTGSGDVSVNQTGGGEIEIQTGSGDVVAGLPSEGGFDLTARTGSGEISMESGMTVDSAVTREGELRGKVRGGGSAVIIQTGSGDIHLR